MTKDIGPIALHGLLIAVAWVIRRHAGQLLIGFEIFGHIIETPEIIVVDGHREEQTELAR